MPRERAGVAELELEADTLGQLLVALAVRFPSLGELITHDRLPPSVRRQPQWRPVRQRSPHPA